MATSFSPKKSKSKSKPKAKRAKTKTKVGRHPKAKAKAKAKTKTKKVKTKTKRKPATKKTTKKSPRRRAEAWASSARERAAQLRQKTAAILAGFSGLPLPPPPSSPAEIEADVRRIAGG